MQYNIRDITQHINEEKYFVSTELAKTLEDFQQVWVQ